MSDEKNETSQDFNDAKAKFRKALEKKKQGQGIRDNKIAVDPKISSGQSGGNALKIFRRKSGSS